ncbi:P1 family peptidase, partial [Streptomyces olivaceus]|uniref:P1 family peptidase n=1 Tax=Streptomyces olivaceus TaxID=47716 RepID=UPI0036C5FE2D
GVGQQRAAQEAGPVLAPPGAGPREEHGGRGAQGPSQRRTGVARGPAPPPRESVGAGADGPGPAADAGSCMIVVATDAPLDARRLTRVARRAVFALARTGAAYSHGSGDYAVAFCTRPDAGAAVADADLGPLFDAVLDGVEEAVLNSLLAADTTTGFGGRTVSALPADALLGALRGPVLPGPGAG